MMGSAATGAAAWVVPPHARAKYVEICRKSATNGYVSGQRAKMLLGQSGLPTGSLRAIWDLADQDKDGALNQAEFVVSGLPPIVPTSTLLLQADAGGRRPLLTPAPLCPARGGRWPCTSLTRSSAASRSRVLLLQSSGRQRRARLSRAEARTGQTTTTGLRISLGPRTWEVTMILGTLAVLSRPRGPPLRRANGC